MENFFIEFKMLKNEYWWGGTVIKAEYMPFDSETVVKINLSTERVTQSAPLFLSSCGRYLWSEDAFVIEFNKGNVTVESDSKIFFKKAGNCLRDAYIAAMNEYFPFEKNIHTPREFYKHPQFNTWMELIKNENQKDIIKYAEEIIENGYNPGILVIDGGAYMPDSFILGLDFYGDYTIAELNNAWMEFAASYKYHEVKDSWKQGGKAMIQRLLDKKHSWDDHGLNCLIPQGCFTGLIGSPFICPDMVGGGSWTAFVYGKHDEELFIRMAQCSALFPMMQFSSLPWRHLSEKAQKICRDMARLHESIYTYLDDIVTYSEKTGEPIVRSMEYQFPNNGYEKINSQFMLGENILSAPVTEKGSTSKKVYIPNGTWVEQNTKKEYTGPAEYIVDAPIDILPWFMKKQF